MNSTIDTFSDLYHAIDKSWGSNQINRKEMRVQIWITYIILVWFKPGNIKR